MLLLNPNPIPRSASSERMSKIYSTVAVQLSVLITSSSARISNNILNNTRRRRITTHNTRCIPPRIPTAAWPTTSPLNLVVGKG